MGHLSFGLEEKMKEAYEEIDRLVGEVAKTLDCPVLIVSDHGMERMGKGRYGDHTMNGFWSSNDKLDLDLNMPRITAFYKIISQVGGMNG